MSHQQNLVLSDHYGFSLNDCACVSMCVGEQTDSGHRSSSRLPQVK